MASIIRSTLVHCSSGRAEPRGAAAPWHHMRMSRRARLDPTEVALILALLAVLAIAALVLWPAAKRDLLALVGAAGAPAVPAAQANEANEGAWRTGPELPTPRTEVAAAVVGGTIYVLGG